MIRALGFALLVTLLLTSAIANADELFWEQREPTPTPEIWYPTPQNRPYGVAFQLKAPGPGKAWQIRAAARAVDEALPQVRIFRWGDHPRAQVIKVEIVDASELPDGVGGLCWTYVDAKTPIRILLADDVLAWGRPYTAAHELAHALGLYHHQLVGAVGFERATRYLSAVELAALGEWYQP